MKKTMISIAALASLLASSCGSVLLERLGTNSLVWSWGGEAAASASGSVSGSRAITDADPDTGSLVLAFGIKGAQSGILTASHSGSPDRSMAFNVQALAPDGVTVLGTFAESESLDVSDPSVINEPGLAVGTKVSVPYSTFINRVGASARTALHLSRQVFIYNPIQAELSRVNEVVFRLATDSYLDWNDEWQPDTTNQANGCTVITQPHFIYTKDGETESYASIKGNLLVNGDPDYFMGFEYIAFVPSTFMGPKGNYVVSGPFSDMSAADWKEDYSYDPGLVAMLDDVAGLDSASPTIAAQRAASARWNQAADYYKSFFAKFSASKSIMFSSQIEADGPWSCNSKIMFVAMSQSVSLGVDRGVQVDIDFSALDISISDGVMSVVGDPPFRFVASVVP